jgi:hypothetical protein
MTEPHRDLVVIRSYSDGIAARIAQAALDAHDIPSLVIGDDAGGVYPALTFSHGVRLAVAHQDAVRALRVLDAPPTPPDSE